MGTSVNYPAGTTWTNGKNIMTRSVEETVVAPTGDAPITEPNPPIDSAAELTKEAILEPPPTIQPNALVQFRPSSKAFTISGANKYRLFEGTVGAVFGSSSGSKRSFGSASSKKAAKRIESTAALLSALRSQPDKYFPLAPTGQLIVDSNSVWRLKEKLIEIGITQDDVALNDATAKLLDELLPVGTIDSDTLDISNEDLAKRFLSLYTFEKLMIVHEVGLLDHFEIDGLLAMRTEFKSYISEKFSQCNISQLSTEDVHAYIGRIICTLCKELGI
jgi:hypothetical protein